MNERDFKGVWIPKAVWLDDRLNALDKVILTEIDSLDQSERGCYASNRHLAEFCQCSETKVSTAISKLVKLGYVYVQKFDGRTRELKSSLTKFERQTLKNCEADSQVLKESNTDTNPDTNPEKKSGRASRFTPPTVDEVKAYCQERQNGIDAEAFVDFYVSKGWKVGSQPMRDWKAAVRTWERRDGGRKGKNGVKLLPESEQDHILDGIL